MQLEVLHDPVEMSYITGAGLEYEPRRHRLLPHSPWLAHIRRVSGNDRLLLYYHQELGTYVLAAWVHRPRTGKGPGLMVEIEVMEESPDNGRPPSTGYILSRLMPQEHQARQLKKKASRAATERALQHMAEVEAKRDAVKYLRRKGEEATAYAIQHGLTPWKLPDPDSVKQLQDLVRRMK